MEDCPWDVEIFGRIVVKCVYPTDFDTVYSRALALARKHKTTARLWFGGKSYDIEPTDQN